MAWKGVVGGPYEETQPGLGDLPHVSPIDDPAYYSFPGRPASLLVLAKGFDLIAPSSVLTTSEITSSVLSFLVALDHIFGAVPRPRPVLPDCVLPTIYLCFSLQIAWSTAGLDWGFGVLPIWV